MNAVLVTGGAGFIGSNFVRWLLRNDPEIKVVVLDALTYAGNRENLKGVEGQLEFVHGDICDGTLVGRLLRQHRIDTIVHLAAETHVDRSLFEPQTFMRTNVMGTLALLEAARSYCRRPHREGSTFRFHHVSTDEVYGSLEAGEPWAEEARYDPHSPYAASKAASDHLVRAYGRTYDLPFTITNCSNNYGPYQFPEKLIPLIVSNAIEGLPLPLYGDGQQRRDWLYVEDHCQAIWTVVKRGCAGETYNVGGADNSGNSGSQPSNLGIVEAICSILDDLKPTSRRSSYRKLIRFVPDRPGHDRRYAVDSTKIRRELGWSPEHPLEDGLNKTVRWYLENRAWVDSIRRRRKFKTWMEKNYSRRAGSKGAGE